MDFDRFVVRNILIPVGLVVEQVNCTDNIYGWLKNQCIQLSHAFGYNNRRTDSEAGYRALRIEVEGHSSRQTLTKLTELIGDCSELQSIAVEGNWNRTCVLVQFRFSRECEPFIVCESSRVRSIDRSVDPNRSRIRKVQCKVRVFDLDFFNQYVVFITVITDGPFSNRKFDVNNTVFIGNNIHW